MTEAKTPMDRATDRFQAAVKEATDALTEMVVIAVDAAIKATEPITMWERWWKKR